MKSAPIGRLVLAVVLTVLAPPVRANFTPTELAAISASPLSNAALPLNLSFRDENGRQLTLGEAIAAKPSLVVFADYTCHTLCGPIVEFTAAGLSRTGLRSGIDYRLIVIGLDPKDGLGTARAMRANHIDSDNPVATAAIFLSGDEATIGDATNAVGLHYAYDAEHDQYAHPAAVYVVDAGGRVRRVLSPLALDGGDLRFALVDAGHGTVGNLADRIYLLCYGYDPMHGVYTERITTMLGYATGAIIVVLLTSIVVMVARERRGAAT